MTLETTYKKEVKKLQEQIKYYERQIERCRKDITTYENKLKELNI